MEQVLSVESVYGRPWRGCGSSDRQLTVGMHDARESGRGEDQRVGDRLTEQGGGDVDGADVAQHPGTEDGLGKGVGVAGERALVVGAAIDVVEDPAGKAALGDAPQVGHRGGMGQPAFDRITFEFLEPDDGLQVLQKAHCGSFLQSSMLLATRALASARTRAPGPDQHGVPRPSFGRARIDTRRDLPAVHLLALEPVP